MARQSLSVYHSDKIRVISFLMIVLVFYVHSYYQEAEQFEVAHRLESIIDFGLSSIAVPMFFCISGFLFFFNIETLKDIINKQKKRVKTLVVPYFLWNVLVLLLFVGLKLIPFSARFVNTDVISLLQSHNPILIANAVFIAPIGFHLWFLRDLIVFIAVSPVLFFLIKKTSWLFIILLYPLCIRFNMIHGLLFFCLGGIVSLRYSLDAVDRLLQNKWLLVLALCFFVFYVVSVSFHFFPHYLKPFAIFSGLLVTWRLFDIVHCLYNLATKQIVRFTFFIYCFHEPFFEVIKKGGVMLLGESDLSYCILYLVNPIIAIIIIYTIGIGFKRFLPTVYRVLTGAR